MRAPAPVPPQPAEGHLAGRSPLQRGQQDTQGPPVLRAYSQLSLQGPAARRHPWGRPAFLPPDQVWLCPSPREEAVLAPGPAVSPRGEGRSWGEAGLSR